MELKWDKSVEGAIYQIKEQKYVEALKEYTGNLLLMGINHNKMSEKLQKPPHIHKSILSASNSLTASGTSAIVNRLSIKIAFAYNF